ncbi:hypothetical protein [Streptomyces lavendulocolor]|uniref:hypothetical protein n=1 Tax=Streptomyces lavendulocolor TaxID=67316 RepID=UPI003C2C559E
MSRRPLSLPSTVSDDDDDFDLTPAPAAAPPRTGGGVLAELTGADLSTPVTVDQVPAPYASSEAPELDDKERADLETCERAVHGMHAAFTVAGKALATIKAARLYRETHGTFEAYLIDRWGMKRAHAYRLIEAWPVAAALSPRGDTPPEKHVRALLPVVKRHGVEAARAVYEELRQQDARVTTTRVTEAVSALPPRIEAPEDARAAVRAAAAEGRITTPGKPAVGVPHQAGGADGDRNHDQDGEVQDQRDDVANGARALATLSQLLEAQRRIYDELGGVVPSALAHDPSRADMLLREIRQYANRTAYRVRGRTGDKATPSQ